MSLRYNELNKSPNSKSERLTDIYLVISGEKFCTRKIFLNNYELRTKVTDNAKEKFFEFQCKDIGKIYYINLSIDDDDNPNNCLYIDFIEITIKNKSEAYK